MTFTVAEKPLKARAYGSIGHLPGSKLGPGDHHVHEGQARILTEKPRKGDTIIVQEKLDGTCAAVAKVDGRLVPLQRKGYPARSSPYRQHHMFADWVEANVERFDAVLHEGERIVGEWLAQAHGTRYDLTGREPFAVFDIMRGKERATQAELDERIGIEGFRPIFRRPTTLSYGILAVPLRTALALLGPCGHYGAVEAAEGVVYRCETGGKVEFLAKWVRHDFPTGCYLPDISGQPEVWNWQPEVPA